MADALDFSASAEQLQPLLQAAVSEFIGELATIDKLQKTPNLVQCEPQFTTPPDEIEPPKQSFVIHPVSALAPRRTIR